MADVAAAPIATAAAGPTAGQVETYPEALTSDFSSNFVAKRPKVNENGKGKSVYVDYGTNKFYTCVFPEVELAFPIRPSGGDDDDGPDGPSIKDYTRCNVEFKLDPANTALGAKLDELDETIKDLGFKANTSADPQDAWYPELRADMIKEARTNPMMAKAFMRGKFSNFRKAGSVDKDGGQYADTFRGKADGWAKHIDRLIVEEYTTKDGKTGKMVRDCVWKPRLCRFPLGKNDTRFYLWVAKTGKWTSKVPNRGPDGKFVVLGQQPNGTPVYEWRWVGPQDAPRCSRVTPVMTMNKVHIGLGCNFIATVKEMWIKPPPPITARCKVAGHEAEEVSAEDAMEALDEVAAAAPQTDAHDNGNEHEDSGVVGEPSGGGVAGFSAVSAQASGTDAAPAAPLPLPTDGDGNCDTAPAAPPSAAGERIGKRRRAEEDTPPPAAAARGDTKKSRRPPTVSGEVF